MDSLLRMTPILTIMITVFVPAAFAQEWGNDVRLDDNAAASYVSLCVDPSDNIHAVWIDTTDAAVYYKRSTDRGETWESVTRLTGTGASAYRGVDIAADSRGTLHLVWDDDRSGSEEIYYMCSHDGGVTWETEISILGNGYKGVCSLDINADTLDYLHIVFGKYREPNYNSVFHCRSTDGGTTWGALNTISGGDNFVDIAGISADSSNQLVCLCSAFINKFYIRLYRRTSTDNGATWGSGAWLETTSQVKKRFPHVVCDQSDTFHLVYVNHGSMEIYSKNSTDAGETWGNHTKLVSTQPGFGLPRFCVDPANTLHLLWVDNRDGDYELFHITSLDGGITWSTEEKLTDTSGHARYPRILADSRNNLHVAWKDDRSGAYGVYYKKYAAGPELVNPLVDIKCNGQDAAVQVLSSENCNLTIEIQANDFLGTRCDLFVMAQKLATGVYYTYGNFNDPLWKQGPSNEFFTGPLNNVPLTVVLDQPLALGDYKAWLVLEGHANGKFNQTAIEYLDEVDFTIIE